MPRTSMKTLSLPKTKQDKKEEIQAVTKLEVVTTPVAVRKTLPEDEYSPIQIRCTQDGGDDELDVVWDWNSPQSRVKKVYNRQRKRYSNNLSPQIPRKLQSKHNLIPQFTSLKAELEKLSRHNEEDINSNETDFEENLFTNLIDSTSCLHDATKETKPLVPSDLFGDDSFDDELIRCSQQVEATISKPQPKKIEFLLQNHSATNIADDSFDAILTEFTDDDIIRLSQENEKTPVKNTTPRKFYRTNSTPVNSPRAEITNVSKCSTPLRSDKLPRTKSANDCSKFYVDCSTPVKTCSPEEIEKKRMDAKARLDLKKFQIEIEKKRLEALEKLKRNKIQRNLH